MFEDLYNDIGGKIKSLARWTFIIGAVAALISGVATMAQINFFTGLIVMFLGPVVAFVSTWLLYGFGELIDKAGEIAQNTKAAAQSRTPEAAPAVVSAPRVDVLARAAQVVSRGPVRCCPHCGEVTKSDKCEMCGRDIS